MNKHIWYRLEYKSFYETCVIYATVTGIMALFSIGWNIFDYQGMAGVIVSSIFPIISLACWFVGYLLKHIDKHEWELTKKIKGGQTK